LSTSHNWLSRSNLYFKFLTFGHSGAQPWAPWCPNIKNLKTWVALNNSKCNLLTSLRFKGSTLKFVHYRPTENSSFSSCGIIVQYSNVPADKCGFKPQSYCGFTTNATRANYPTVARIKPGLQFLQRFLQFNKQHAIKRLKVHYSQMKLEGTQ